MDEVASKKFRNKKGDVGAVTAEASGPPTSLLRNIVLAGAGGAPRAAPTLAFKVLYVAARLSSAFFSGLTGLLGIVGEVTLASPLRSGLGTPLLLLGRSAVGVLATLFSGFTRPLRIVREVPRTAASAARLLFACHISSEEVFSSKCWCG
jgi:hypothetical protein